MVRLSPADCIMAERILAKLDSPIELRRQLENLVWLTFADLYVPLDETEHRFLRAFQHTDPQRLYSSAHSVCQSDTPPDLVKIQGQQVRQPDGTTRTIPTQFLPRNVFEAYAQMAAAMKTDIDRTVFVESGYRCPPYQLYLFLFYLKNHDYSMRETIRFVAWPGFSEHGCPQRQAVDLINEAGISGQDNPPDFEATDEFRWLEQNARRFGFELSYLKGTNMAYEPWHWRYVGAGV